MQLPSVNSLADQRGAPGMHAPSQSSFPVSCRKNGQYNSLAPLSGNLRSASGFTAMFLLVDLGGGVDSIRPFQCKKF